jgi:osmotically-inducible protein OsmY
MKPEIVAILLALFVTLTSCSHVIEATHTGPLDTGKETRSVGNKVDDEVIETTGLVNIRKADKAMEYAHIVVVSYNGNALLAGQVPSDNMKRLAESTLREIAGVRTVYTELEVRAATNADVRTVDAWITAKVKSSLAGQSLGLFSEVKVVTENGKVYLLGLVSRKNADLAATIASNTSGVQKVVKLFEYTD